MRTIFNILGPAHQPGRRAEHPDGRVPPRPGRHPGARAAAPRRRARGGRLRHATAWTRSRSARRRWSASCKDGEVREYEIHPEDFGLHDGEQPRRCSVETPAQSKAMLEAVLGNEPRAGARHRRAQRRRGAVRGQRRADDRRRRRAWRAQAIADGAARGQARPGRSRSRSGRRRS